jgi:hypothetical protein
MPKLKYTVAIFIFFISAAAFAQDKTPVKHFNQIIVSPFIQVNFVSGTEENVVIEKSTVPEGKIRIEVSGKTLRVYLEGAKDLPKNEDGYSGRHALYHGTVLTATIYYKTLNKLSIRGDETEVCESLLEGKKFILKMYGNPHVFLTQVNLRKLKAALYGNGKLEIKAGAIGEQHYTAYGESTVNTLAINNQVTKITAFGESRFRLHVSDALRIVCFGEASVAYTGDPVVYKWLHLGEVQVSKID